LVPLLVRVVVLVIIEVLVVVLRGLETALTDGRGKPRPLPGLPDGGGGGGEAVSQAGDVALVQAGNLDLAPPASPEMGERGDVDGAPGVAGDVVRSPLP